MALIRLAGEEDAAKLAAIYGYYVENTAVTFETNAPTAEEFRSRILKTLEEYPFLLAEEKGEILGYACASSFHSKPAYRPSAELSLYIRPDRRGEGTGPLLYSCLEPLLKLQHVYNFYVCISVTERERDEHLSDASVEFHRHMGYSHCGGHRNCGSKFGKWYGIVWMEKCPECLPDAPEVFIPFRELRQEAHELLERLQNKRQ